MFRFNEQRGEHYCYSKGVGCWRTPFTVEVTYYEQGEITEIGLIYLCARMRVTSSATSAAAALSRAIALTKWDAFPLNTPVDLNEKHFLKN